MVLRTSYLSPQRAVGEVRASYLNRLFNGFTCFKGGHSQVL